MKLLNCKLFALCALFCLGGFMFQSCEKDEDMMDMNPILSLEFELEDQVARPAINTVFNATDNGKNTFNITPPAQQAAAFSMAFKDRLNALNPGYTTNALGLDDATFTGLLATDVLNVSTTGKTTFFDGTNVLTGRAPADDVIDVELLLIFGGPNGMENPGLTSDNVNANDKAFSNSFPYLASPH